MDDQSKIFPVSIHDIRDARVRIDPFVMRTPLIRSEALSTCSKTPVLLKLENLQPTGSFKVRGATNRLLLMSADERNRGVITVSSGNHGSTKKMQWGFLGADLVLSGHDHIYERFTEGKNSAPVYIVNGLGGQNKKKCNENAFDRDRFEHFCYDEQYGAMLIEANTTEMVVKFITVDNKIVDTIVLQQSISS